MIQKPLLAADVDTSSHLDALSPEALGELVTMSKQYDGVPAVAGLRLLLEYAAFHADDTESVRSALSRDVMEAENGEKWLRHNATKLEVLAHIALGLLRRMTLADATIAANEWPDEKMAAIAKGRDAVCAHSFVEEPLKDFVRRVIQEKIVTRGPREKFEAKSAQTPNPSSIEPEAGAEEEPFELLERYREAGVDGTDPADEPVREIIKRAFVREVVLVYGAHHLPNSAQILRDALRETYTIEELPAHIVQWRHAIRLFLSAAKDGEIHPSNSNFVQEAEAEIAWLEACIADPISTSAEPDQALQPDAARTNDPTERLLRLIPKGERYEPARDFVRSLEPSGGRLIWDKSMGHLVEFMRMIAHEVPDRHVLTSELFAKKDGRPFTAKELRRVNPSRKAEVWAGMTTIC